MNTRPEVLLLDSWISEAEHFVVATHTHPDGDALGSSSAVLRYLRQRGKTDVVLVRESAPATISFIAGDDPVAQGDEAAAAILRADLIICTDFNGLSRSGEFEEPLREAKARKVLMDHHLDPQTGEFDLVFSATNVSSACEMVWSVLREMPSPADFASDLGEALMAGMTTDTNNFANSVFPSTMSMTAELIAAGVDRDAILQQLYNRYRPNRILAFSDILANHMTLREDGLAVLTVSKETWHEFGLEEGELEGLVNVPLTMDKVKMSIYLRESDTAPEVRVSIRSKKGWSANRVARECFNGGGHEQASGGKLRIPEDIAALSEAAAYIEKNVKI